MILDPKNTIPEGTYARLDRSRGQQWGVKVKGRYPGPGMEIQVQVTTEAGETRLRKVRLIKVHRNHAMAILLD